MSSSLSVETSACPPVACCLLLLLLLLMNNAFAYAVHTYLPTVGCAALDLGVQWRRQGGKTGYATPYQHYAYRKEHIAMFAEN